MAGLVYAKERCVLGIPTGMIYGDGTVGNLVIAAEAEREAVLTAALENLLDTAGVRGLRLMVPPQGYERRVATHLLRSGRLEVSYAAMDKHILLPLPESLEEYLQSVGYHTRRNLRYYRRRFENSGGEFVEQVSLDEFAQAARWLRPKCRASSDDAKMLHALQWLRATERPLLVGLKKQHGEWVSVAGGWREGGRTTLLVQLNNDREHPHASLCTVLRACLVEMLIRDRASELLFWGGTPSLLPQSAMRVPALGMRMDMPTRGWRMARWTTRQLAAVAPSRFAALAAWFAPLAGEARRGTETEKLCATPQDPPR